MFYVLKHFARVKKLNEESVTKSELNRCLTVLDLTTLGIGATFGAGVYVVAGEIARNIAGPGVVISFFIAGIASVLSGLCYAEFGARVPKAGSAYIYSYVTVGELCAFVIGWNLILEYMIGAAAVARAWSAYFDSLLEGRIRNFLVQYVGYMHVPGLGHYPDFFAFTVTLLIVLLQSTGVKRSSRFNCVITFINIIVISFVIVTGIIYAKKENWEKTGFFPYGVKGVLSGSATAFFAFVGFDVIATTGEEAKNPGRNIPLAIILSLTVCFLGYFGVSAVVTLVVPYNQLQAEAALPRAFEQAGAEFAKYIISVGALCGLTSALSGSLIALPRLIYAMAGDGLVFKIFARVHKSSGVPVIATAVLGLMTATFALLFELQELVEMMSIGTLQAYTIVACSVLLLRYQDTFVGLSKHSSPPENEDPNARVPTKKTSMIVCCATALLFLLLFAFSAFLAHATPDLKSGKPWAVAIGIILTGMLIAGITVIWKQPQSNVVLNFKVPGVPVLPVVSMFINILLMMELTYITWIRFGLWMMVGLTIYLFYGMRHSVENEKNFVQQPEETEPLQPKEEEVGEEEIPIHQK